MLLAVIKRLVARYESLSSNSDSRRGLNKERPASRQRRSNKEASLLKRRRASGSRSPLVNRTRQAEGEVMVVRSRHSHSKRYNKRRRNPRSRVEAAKISRSKEADRHNPRRAVVVKGKGDLKLLSHT